MLFKKSLVIVALSLMSAGCDNAKSQPNETVSTTAQATLIPMPALPIIQNTLRQMAPTLQGEFDLSVIQRICLLARGEVTLERVRHSLINDGVDPDSIPMQGHPLSYLVNQDQAGRQTLCAAWLANSVTLPLDRNEFVEKRPREIIEKENKKTLTKTLWDETIVEEQLNTVLASKMSLLRANAEFYALIANELAQKRGQTLDQYAAEVKSTFAAAAPYYLKRVQEHFSPSAKGYQLTAYQQGNYAFTTDGGYHFARDAHETLLTYGGMNWLGKGEIMGEKYVLYVALFPEQVVTAIRTASPVH
ncbi:hypothetical protein CIG19_13815 [Enterobacterales bacterium CwR94]|nr:hypothetical protein CIG19_13815 [Enterobacterales bacterium CwR94]